MNYPNNLSRFKGIPVILFILLLFAIPTVITAQHSVAREWSEVMLEAIRKDFARPTVHARNLFHVSTVMYDAWAAYEDKEQTYFLGKTIAGFTCPFDGIPAVANKKEAQEIAMSYAAYRLLRYRFQNSPGAATSLPLLDNLMTDLGLNPFFTDTDYATNGAPALGNYLAAQMILFGQQDGANELNDYNNTYYFPVNPTLAPEIPGNQSINNPNRWQPLSLSVFVDQSGNPIPGSSIPFLSPEWGNVVPFSLNFTDKTSYTRFGRNYDVYMDCGDPPYIQEPNGGGNTAEYQWGFALVSIWASHNDPNDTTLWDISPASIGNVQDYPTDIPGLRNFYNTLEGGDPGTGHAINPTTGMPYQPQIVKRSDYTRVLAEFWADGPDSETPPGHWFTILNYVNDNPAFEKRWKGAGPILDDLEWDVKAYFTLGGAVHDAAIVAWSNKGWYDYLRPVSAIRYMAEQGQSTDTFGVNYDPLGLPLVPGKIELVTAGDPLAGFANQHVGKIKLYTWRGPDYISNPDTDVAGVGWILAENWWPYQRPTFVTPPFAGYVSGHSTFSRAAAEVMTAMTGDPFFPGGMGEFIAPANEFLVFEDGPSQDITLQWATYRDASDQCSLSRIWGGIHPPADDIPGRLAGIEVGEKSFELADSRFDPFAIPELVSLIPSLDTIKDIHAGENGFSLTLVFEEAMDTMQDPNIFFTSEDPQLVTISGNSTNSKWLNTYTFNAVYDVANTSETLNNITINVEGVANLNSTPMDTFSFVQPFYVNTKDAKVITSATNNPVINDPLVGSGTFEFRVDFDAAMDLNTIPSISFPIENPASTMILNAGTSSWVSDSAFLFVFDILDMGVEISDVDVLVQGGKTKIGNDQVPFMLNDAFSIDTKNPELAVLLPTPVLLADAEVGIGALKLDMVFSEAMDTNLIPVIDFPNNDPTLQHLTLNISQSQWVSLENYLLVYDLIDVNDTMYNIDLNISGLKDQNQNEMAIDFRFDQFSIDTKNPESDDISTSVATITKEDIGIDGFGIAIDFNEPMDININPAINFPVEDPLGTILVPNNGRSSWVDAETYIARFDVNNSIQTLLDIDVMVEGGVDVAGNQQLPFTKIDAFDVEILDTLTSGFQNLSPEESVQLELQPNPIPHGQDIQLSMKGFADQFQIQVIDLQGKTVVSQIWEKTLSTENTMLTTRFLHRGIYFVRVKNKTTSWIQKLLIQ